jgi:hypothetical protein
MYTRKSKGPNSEPRGTPCNNLAQLETLLHASFSLYGAVFDIYFSYTIYKVHNPYHILHTISV